MSKIIPAKNVHKISVKTKNPNQLMVGANTILTLDGHELYGTTSFKLEVSAKGIAKVTIELLANVTVEESIVQDVEIS